MSERVLFGVGAEGGAAQALIDAGARRVLCVALDHHADGARRVSAQLGDRSVGLFTTSSPQVPAAVVQAAVQVAREREADWVVAHGGGTPIGVAKAMALEVPVRVGAIPTTYAGSERTDIWGVTRDGRKVTGRDPRVRPSLVVYDPDLTLALPRVTSLQSLLNALAHSLDALFDTSAPADARAAAVESLIPLMDGLRAIAADPTDLNGRTAALRGASLASFALGRASMALHHKLAHVLGGSFGTPHAATHATLLSYTFGFNAVVSPDALDLVRTAWGTPDPPAWLYDLTREIGLPTSLRELGLDEVALVHVADEVMAARYPNPREVTRDGVIGLLTDALHDRRPSLLTRRSSFARSVPEPHGALQVTVRGPPIDDARVVVIALHGRGASADRFVADLERRLGPSPDVAWMAPQARHNTWYPKGFLAPVADNQPGLGSALEAVQALWDEVEARVGRERIALVGFSQGACLLLTWLSTTSARPVSALAFTGGPTPLPDARYTSASGLRLHLGRSARDPWVNVEVFDAGAASFRAAGALVDVTVVPGDLHAVHAPDVEALSREIERLRSGPAA